MGQKEEIERLIGTAYAQLRSREWLDFDRTISELSLYNWGMIEDVISGKAMRASLPSRLHLWYIYDAVTAFPYASSPLTASQSHSHSPRYPELTWEWAGGFYDGEGYFDATMREYYQYGYRYRFLQTRIDLGQKDRAILEKLRDFVEGQLGTVGRIVPPDYRPIHLLTYLRHEDCLRLAKTIYPYLHLPLRRTQARSLITTTRSYAQEKLKEETVRRRPALASRYRRLLTI